MPDPLRYIVVWRRSVTARYLDSEGTGKEGEIAVFQGQPEDLPLIADESSLIAYINADEDARDTDRRAVEVSLAHKVLGWSVS